jgi:hypothetical protein
MRSAASSVGTPTTRDYVAFNKHYFGILLVREAIGGFPDAVWCDSWVVGLVEGRPWRSGVAISRRGLGRFWKRWATRRGGGFVRPRWQG